MRRSHVLLMLAAGTTAVRAQEKPQPLPVVPVTAEAELVRSAKLREFDRRRSMGHGRFLTEVDLEKDQHRLLGDVLKRLPGLMLVRRRVAGTSPSALFVVSSRGSATITNVSTIFGTSCPVALWLDGVPVYRGLDRVASGGAFGGGSRPPGQISEPPFDINSIQTMHVAAIEFYSGPATMPPELNATQGTCGALVIWTK